MTTPLEDVDKYGFGIMGAIPFYLITNKESLMKSTWVQNYPRHLILAHLLLEDPVYAAFVRDWIIEMGKREKPLHIIMDNGAYEKEIVGSGDLIELALETRPDVIVMPDAVGEPWSVTWKLGKQFIEEIETELSLQRNKKRMRAGITRYSPTYMYASQGISSHDVLSGYKTAIRELSPKRFVMGLGLGYKQWMKEGDDPESEDARRRMVDEVFAIPGSSNFRWHVLGARWEATEVFDDYAEYICGLDTFKPCQSALQGMRYPAHAGPKISHRDAGVVDEDILSASVRSFGHDYKLYTGPRSIPYMGG